MRRLLQREQLLGQRERLQRAARVAVAGPIGDHPALACVVRDDRRARALAARRARPAAGARSRAGPESAGGSPPRGPAEPSRRGRRPPTAASGTRAARVSSRAAAARPRTRPCCRRRPRSSSARGRPPSRRTGRSRGPAAAAALPGAPAGSGRPRSPSGAGARWRAAAACGRRPAWSASTGGPTSSARALRVPGAGVGQRLDDPAERREAAVGRVVLVAAQVAGGAVDLDALDAEVAAGSRGGSPGPRSTRSAGTRSGS